MLTNRQNDGRFGSFKFVPGTDPGDWRLAPPAGPNGIVAQDPAPWVGYVRPFLVPDVDMLRTDGPNDLTSAAYAADFNEVKRLGSLTSTTRTRGSDGGGDLLAGQRDRDLEPRLPVARPRTGARHRRQRAPLRDDQPGRGRRARSVAGTTRRTTASGGRSRRSGRRRATGTRRPRPIRRGFRSSTRPSRFRAPPLVTPGFPDHPSGHACISSAIVHTLQEFFGTDKVSVHGDQQQVPAAHRVRPGPSSASRSRSRRSSALGCGAASTSEPRTCREPCSARRSNTTWRSTSSSR